MAVDPARAKSLFLNAAEFADPAERAVYLDRECGGDVELRKRVEALLASGGAAPEGDATGMFDPTAPATLAPTAADDVGTRPPPALETSDFSTGAAAAADATFASAPGADRKSGSVEGQLIAGRYTLVEVIGEGGMGSVYRASQSQPIKRQVALKLIKTGMNSRDVLARFDAERQALALMDHPNIARIYDGGVTDSGQPFFVMELVDGVPLTEYCDQKRLALKARLDLFVAVCQAVQHAHQKGIIHRDLKPSNVLVTEVDGRPTPKVIDFGVAKATEVKLTDMSFADTSAIVGTPTYMSPEQADPTSMDIDTRTDVYALGVMLYELLVGSPPLDASKFKRGAILEMLRMVREVDPPRPSTKLSTDDALPNIAANRSIDPARLSKLLQGELDWVVMKALEKDRNRRYDTANGLARDIQLYLADEVVEARPPSAGYRLKKFVKRNKGQVIAGCLVFISLVAGIVGTSIGMAQARQANRDLANKNEALVAERAKVEQRFDMARKAIAAFHTTIDEQPELGNEAFRPLRKKLLGAAAGFYRELEGLLAGETDDKSRKALAEGNIQLAELTEKIEDQKQALAVYQKALALHRELAAAPGAGPDARLAVSDTLRRLGKSLAAIGDTSGALRAFEEARQVAEALEAEVPTDAVRQALAASHHSIGGVLSRTGQPAEAMAAYLKALDLQKKLAAAQPANTTFQNDLAQSHINIGIELQERMGKPAEALAAFREALTIRQKMADANPTVIGFKSGLAKSYYNIGVMLRFAEQPEDALAASEKARDLYQELADSNPAVTEFQGFLAGSYQCIAWLLGRSGKRVEAQAADQKALDILQKLADAHPAVTQFQSDLAQSHYSIGKWLQEGGQPREALEAYRKALAIRQKLSESNPSETEFQTRLAGGHFYIGRLLGDTGQSRESLQAFEKARNLYQKLADENHTVPSFQADLASTQNNLGRLLAKEGRFAEAFPALDAGLAIREKLIATDTKQTKYKEDLGLSYAYRGWARTRADQSKEAAADLRQAIVLWDKAPKASSGTRFELARTLALLAKLGTDAKSDVTADEAKAFAARAVAALADAIKDGSSDLTELKEPDFDALRGRDDFHKLVAELEKKAAKPAEPAPPPGR